MESAIKEPNTLKIELSEYCVNYDAMTVFSVIADERAVILLPMDNVQLRGKKLTSPTMMSIVNYNEDTGNLSHETTHRQFDSYSEMITYIKENFKNSQETLRVYAYTKDIGEIQIGRKAPEDFDEPLMEFVRQPINLDRYKEKL